MPEDKMPDNPYPKPHHKPHPSGYWFSSVSLSFSLYTLSVYTRFLSIYRHIDRECVNVNRA